VSKFQLRLSKDVYKKISLFLILIFLLAQFLFPVNLIQAQSNFINNSYHVYVCNGLQGTGSAGEDISGSFYNDQNLFSSSNYDKIKIDDDNFVTYSSMAHLSAIDQVLH